MSVQGQQKNNRDESSSLPWSFARATPSECPVTLVGAGGRMGVLLHERLTQAGYPVRALNKEGDKMFSPEAAKKAVSGAVAVILCVPMEAFAEVLPLLIPVLEAEGNQSILSDIVSIKTLPMRLMEQAYAGPVIGTHPLFGPVPSPVSVRQSPEHLGELKVAVTPGGKAFSEAVDWLCTLLRNLQFTPFVTTAQEHDKAVASIQGLNFVTSVAYFSMLSKHPEFLPFLTPSFQRRLEAARKSLGEDGSIFCTMFSENPSSGNTVEEFREHLSQAAKDIGAALQEARWWLE